MTEATPIYDDLEREFALERMRSSWRRVGKAFRVFGDQLKAMGDGLREGMEDEA